MSSRHFAVATGCGAAQRGRERGAMDASALMECCAASKSVAVTSGQRVLDGGCVFGEQAPEPTVLASSAACLHNLLRKAGFTAAAALDAAKSAAASLSAGGQTAAGRSDANNGPAGSSQ